MINVEFTLSENVRVAKPESRTAGENLCFWKHRHRQNVTILKSQILTKLLQILSSVLPARSCPSEQVYFVNCEIVLLLKYSL